MPMKAQARTDQRQFSRAEVKLNAEIRLDCGLLIEGHTRDLSLCGALLSTERYLPQGHPVRLTLDLEFDGEQCRIRAQGHVARVDDEGVAIAFACIQPESLTPLCHVILANAENPKKMELEMEQHAIIQARELLASLPK